MTLHSRVLGALHTAGEKTAKSATPHLQERAYRAGWSVEAAESLRVNHAGTGSFHATFSDDAGDYEYGTHNRAPIAVARTWHNHLNDELGDEFHKNLREAFGGWL